MAMEPMNIPTLDITKVCAMEGCGAPPLPGNQWCEICQWELLNDSCYPEGEDWCEDTNVEDSFAR